MAAGVAFDGMEDWMAVCFWFKNMPFMSFKI